MTALSSSSTTTFSYTGMTETVTVGASGYYDITADGAQGGAAAGKDQGGKGGLGAMASGEIYLVAGAKLEIVVGGLGASATNNSAAGGGGGSFVIENYDGSSAVDVNEVIAGGGGGGGADNGGGGQTSSTGGGGSAGYLPAQGGRSGGGGGATPGNTGAGGGGGGGFTGGSGGYYVQGSGNFAYPGQNGRDPTSLASATFSGGGGGGGHGGFGGGGGGGSNGAGGGGGFGGGGGGNQSAEGYGGGGGGGSFVNTSALDVSKTGATHTGAGVVTIAPVYAAELFNLSTQATAYYVSLSDAIQAANSDPNFDASDDSLTLLTDAYQPTAMPAIDRAAGLDLTIYGGDHTLNAAGSARGFYVLTGDVTIQSLTIENAVAVGGAGGDGAGGGAGLGGGVYVANDARDGLAPANVTISNVVFENDSAQGGAGGNGAVFNNDGFTYGGGGGGQGGAGDSVRNPGSGGSTGGSGGGGVNGDGGGTANNSLGYGESGGYGGGGGAGSRGGQGGFGGGGGSGQSAGGGGGFGGGGGGAFNFNGPATPGSGGFGGGNGAAASGQFSGGGGGGGLGAGGDIFVQGGATLAIGSQSTLGAGAAAGGQGGPGGQSTGAGGAGEGLGAGIFIQGGTAAAPETITLGSNQTSVETTTVSGVIADVASSGGASGTGGSGGAGGTGALVVTGDGVVDLAVANSFEGGVTVDSGALELGAQDAAGSGVITFATPPASYKPVLEFAKANAPTNALDNFVKGDGIDVTDLTFAGTTKASSVVLDPVSGAYQATFQEGASSVQLDFVSVAPLTTSSFVLSQDGAGTLIAACYARGARIATARGDVAIEDLQIGDLAVTASGAMRPVLWLGHRRLDIAKHPAPLSVWPVKVSAGAFGENLPRRDLWLSPGHNIAAEGALMPISALINGASVAQVKQDHVEYWHVELDAHDVILAEGLPAESYLDSGNRTAFANGGAFIEAHPDFRPKHWAETCLPLVIEGPPVIATKARLIARLAALGHHFGQDADPHIIVDGVRVEPTRLSETQLAFALPPGGRAIALRSRQFVPAHVYADSADGRELGLCLARLEIDGEAIALHDEASLSGWREPEFVDGRFAQRWTTGATPLAPGARHVLLDLASLGCYGREIESGEPVAAISRSRSS